MATPAATPRTGTGAAPNPVKAPGAPSPKPISAAENPTSVFSGRKFIVHTNNLVPRYLKNMYFWADAKLVHNKTGMFDDFRESFLAANPDSPPREDRLQFPELRSGDVFVGDFSALFLLRLADEAERQGVDVGIILVDMPPKSHEWLSLTQVARFVQMYIVEDIRPARLTPIDAKMIEKFQTGPTEEELQRLAEQRAKDQAEQMLKQAHEEDLHRQFEEEKIRQAARGTGPLPERALESSQFGGAAFQDDTALKGTEIPNQEGHAPAPSQLNRPAHNQPERLERQQIQEEINQMANQPNQPNPPVDEPNKPQPPAQTHSARQSEEEREIAAKDNDPRNDPENVNPRENNPKGRSGAAGGRETTGEQPGDPPSEKAREVAAKDSDPKNDPKTSRPGPTTIPGTGRSSGGQPATQPITENVNNPAAPAAPASPAVRKKDSEK